MTIVFVGVDKFIAATRAYARDFSPTSRQMRILYTTLGRNVRDDVRLRITTQGGGTWAPLGKWAKARTGRRKALITERSRVKFRHKTRTVEIGYEPKSDKWNLTKHHKGFTTPGFRGGRVTIPLKNPKPLGIKDKTITIHSAKPSVVPARQIWTSEAKLLKMFRLPIASWTQKVLNRRTIK